MYPDNTSRRVYKADTGDYYGLQRVLYYATFPIFAFNCLHIVFGDERDTIYDPTVVVPNGPHRDCVRGM